MTDTDAAVPRLTTEEAGVAPGPRCTGGHPPPITGGEAEDSGAAVGASPPGGGSTLPVRGTPTLPGDIRSQAP